MPDEHNENTEQGTAESLDQASALAADATELASAAEAAESSDIAEAVEAAKAAEATDVADAVADEAHAANIDSGRSNDMGLTSAFAPVDEDGFEQVGYRGDTDDEYPDALDSLEPQIPPSIFDDGDPQPKPAKGKSGRGKHASAPAASSEEIPSYMRKSRRMRKILIVVVILLVVLLAVGGYFTVRLLETAQNAASQQTQEQQASQDTDALKDDGAQDATNDTAKKTTAPSLTALLGHTLDESLAELQSGATVTSTSDVNEEGNPIKKNVRIALTDEPADSRTGTPSVYLGLNEAGQVIQAGYSAGTASLGYGTLSFSDAVKNENIVEKTLQEAGIMVPLGTVELPADKTQYSTYASDGTTLVKEYCPFSGKIDIDGAEHEWSAVLSYDYTVANASGNLADTIRIIYVYVNA